MEKKTPNKRKSLANSNATPNKIRKADTPVSHNIINKSPNRNGNKSKSPNKNHNSTPKKHVNGNQAKENKDKQSEIVLNKSVNQIKQNQTNGKKSKSPNKNQNMTPNKQVIEKQTTPKKQMNAKQTTRKKQMNAKQTTPKRYKKSKQEEEDDVELMNNSDEHDTEKSSEEMNDSDVEDGADSDENVLVDEDETCDEVQVDEDESDDDAQIDKDESGDEAQVDEADSDEDAQVDEDESGDEAQVDEDESGDEAQVDEDESGEEVQVDEDEEADSDEEENDNDELENDEVGDSDGEAEDEKIDEEDNDEVETEFSVYIEGLKPDLKLDRIFSGCNIKTFKKFNNFRDNSENAVVYLKDMESMKKALAKQEVNINGNIIKVYVCRKTHAFGVHVTNLHPDTDIRDLFNDCNILGVNANVFVYFEDKESMQKALLKTGSEVNGNFITVVPTREITERLKNLTISVHGLHSDVKIEDIFEGCNIKFYSFRTGFKTNRLNGKVDVTFEDEKSVQKALLKHETEYNDSVIEIFRKYCNAFVRGIKENTELEKIFTGCKIRLVKLKVNKDTNELKGAIVHFEDYSSLERALSVKTPPGITVHSNMKNRNDKFGNKSGFIKNKFNKPSYQQTRGNEAKKLLLQELKSQVQKLTEEVYGTSRSRPKPFMKNNTFARRNPRFNN